jgi:hypothetical protein
MTEDKESGLNPENEAEEAKEEKLPHCTTAPSAEHLRGEAEDEPCDDGRGGQ